MVLSRRMKGIAPSGTRRIFDLSQGVRGLINLGIGEPDFKVPGFVTEALKAAADSGMNRYTSNRGLPELRDQISKKLRTENGIDADPAKEIVVTTGATQAISALTNILLNEGDEVVIPTPAFSAYMAAVKLAGGKPVEVKMSEASNYGLDKRRIEKAFTSHTRLLVLNSPQNPTGVAYPREQVTEVCAAAVSRGIYVASDEVYEKFVYAGTRHFSPASVSDFRDKVITINGLSKTFSMTGWRLGFAAANPELIDAMTRYNMYNTVCASSIVQAAGIAALKGPRSFFRPILRGYDRRRKIVCRALEEIGLDFVEPNGAFYVFPRVGKGGTDSNAFSREFLRQFKVATIPGASFGRGGEGHIRMSYSTSEEKLLLALALLGRFIKSWRRAES